MENKEPRFYQATLTEIRDVIAHVYPKYHDSITLDERLPKGECTECGGTDWILLPKESCAVREGGKPYIECMDCGHLTHL